MIKHRDVWDVCCDRCGRAFVVGLTDHAEAIAEEIESTSEHAGFKQALCTGCEDEAIEKSEAAR